MKKISLFIVIALFSAHSVNAQNENSNQKEDFESFMGTVFQQVGKCFEEKDYLCAKNNLLEVENKYLMLGKDKQRDFSGSLQHVYYNLACAYSMQGNTEEALLSYEKAIKNGYSNYNHSKNDSDLDNIRAFPRFKELQNSIREKGDYTYILQKSGPYSKEPPVFTYQPPGASELQILKKYFNLDSIAGGVGNETSRILNLMTWAHNLIRHDGNFMPPIDKRTAISLYEYAKEHDKGINCRLWPYS